MMMIIRKNRWIKQVAFSCFSFFVFSAMQAQPYSRTAFPDVLNLKTTVTDAKKIESTVFSDKGAWHAYALPEKTEDYGGFVGPLVMDMEGQWLANSIAKINIEERGSRIKLEEADVEQHYYPGLLQQSFFIDDLKILQQLIFVSGREALVRTTISNHSKRQRKLTISFTGTVLPDAGLKAAENNLEIGLDKTEHSFSLHFYQPVSIQINEQTYTASHGALTLPAGGTIEMVQSQAYYLQKSERAPSFTKTSFAAELKKNEQRWNGYLKNFFSHTTSLSNQQKRLVVKSIVTLTTNWRSAAKDLLHDGVFPSVNYQGFYGVWSWDSWKQAVGLSYFNVALANDNIRCMFDYMDAYGMVPDCIYTDKKENNGRDTKPPLAAWAVWKVFEASNDRSFVKELYPKLVRYHEWWYQNRDHDRNNLCEYGSTDGTRIAAAWESGMDNAVRFDSAVMLKNNDHAWSLNQESVDLNAYLFAEKEYLAKLATALGKKEEAARWTSAAKELGDAINKQFFDEGKGYYYDKLFGKSERITVEGTEGWIPLWAGISSAEQAKGVMTMMQNETKFNTNVPLPTFTADHPKFDPMNGYWRGPVWLDQFYFGIAGLKKYGYNQLAAELVQKLFKNAEGLMTDEPIYENYHPLTGQGLNAKNFSWSAAHLLMLLAEIEKN